MAFGAIINLTCIYWQQSCGNRGACWLYDVANYRYAYYGCLAALQIGAMVCFGLVYMNLPSEKSDVSNNVSYSIFLWSYSR